MRHTIHGIVKEIKHIVWDWNGTLFDDAHLCVDIMNGCLRRRGLPELTPERYRATFRFPVRDYYLDLGFDFEREPFEVSGTEFIEEYERRRFECGLRDGAEELLCRLRDEGFGQSVLSAYRQESLREMLDHFQLRALVEEALGLDDHYAFGKRDIGLRWIASRAAQRGQTVLIGDTAHDYEVAEAMGVRCLLMPCGHATRERLAACGAPVLESLADVPEAVKATTKRKER